jgi:hypothetical protein
MCFVPLGKSYNTSLLYSHDFSIQTVNIGVTLNQAGVKSAIQRLAETQFTYFFGILFTLHFEAL